MASGDDIRFAASKYAQQCTIELQQLQTDDGITILPPPINPPEALPVTTHAGPADNMFSARETASQQPTDQQPPPIIDSPLIGGPFISNPRRIRVGIVGAGAAGLYAAMLLDSVGISYEILEASNHAGGRVFTHRFQGNGQWNYFDVGPMRFPDTPFMYRVFDLMRNRLHLQEKLIPYYLVDSKGNQVLEYNSIRIRHQDVKQVSPSGDSPDFWNDSYRTGGAVSNRFVSRGWQYWLSQCLDPFRNVFVKDGFAAGYRFMMQYDRYSTRMFMQTAINTPLIKKEAYPDLAINWIERMAAGTGMFDLALSEMIISSLEFDYPTAGLFASGSDPVHLNGEADAWKWYCLAGGSQVIIDAMVYKVKTKPTINRRVVAISHTPPRPPWHRPWERVNEPPQPDDPTVSVPSNERPPLWCDLNHLDDGFWDRILRRKPITITSTSPYGSAPYTSDYDYVISTIPLSNLRLVDLESCRLSYLQKEGIRTLHYGGSCKIGLKFKTRWWQEHPNIGIVGGQSKTDRSVRTVVYPSYGVDDPKADAVMIASYCWAQDSHRLGGLMHGRDTFSEEVLIQRVLQDLTILHNISLSFLQDELIDHFAYDWYSNPHSLGAFAMFGPAQFKNVFPALTQPAAGGRLFFAGEALSTHHGWIEGALESAYRSVTSILRCALLDGPLRNMEDEWKNEGLPSELRSEWADLALKQAQYGASLSAGPRPDTIQSH